MIFRDIRIFIITLLLFSLLPGISHSQDVDIVSYLKRIENGSADEVRRELTGLKQGNPDNPSIMFLEGVLTENGQKAVLIYQDIVDNYPDSKYADAALYRIYSYYYALGLYESAEKKLAELTNNYPESPYIKIAKINQLPVNPGITREEEVPPKQKFVEPGNESRQAMDNFTIQAGAFSVKENAEALRLEFEKSGFISETKTKLVAGTTFHIVYVGKFSNENDAENFLKTINEKFNLTGRVIITPR
jgi:tetratricopeptide (TPR) repeat protein